MIGTCAVESAGSDTGDADRLYCMTWAMGKGSK